MDERKFYEMGKSISSSFQSSDEDGTQEEAVALKTKAKQIKAYQMLVAILNLGDENTAVKKIAEMYQSQSESEEIAGVAGAGGKELKELQAKFESKSKDREAPVFEIIIPSKKVFQPDSFRFREASPQKLLKLGKWIEAVKDKVSVQIRSWVVAKDQKSFVGNLSLSSSRAIAVADIFGKAGIYNDRISAEGKVFEKIDNKKIGKLTRLQRREMPEEELVHILINRLPQD